MPDDSAISDRLRLIEQALRLQRLPISPLLTISECAKYLRLSPPTVRKLIESGELGASAMVAGKRTYYRISQSDIERYLDGLRVKGKMKPAAPDTMIRVPKGLI